MGEDNDNPKKPLSQKDVEKIQNEILEQQNASPPSHLVRKEQTTDFSFPRMNDVILDDDTRGELEEIISGITNRGVYETMGGSPGQIYLFSGPPGVGKTFGAKALRNEVYNRGFNVFWEEYNIGEQGTAFINRGATNMRAFYDNMIAQTRDGGVGFIFKDELEVLLSSRGGLHSHKEDDKITNELMKIWQELQDHFPNVYVIGATNHPEMVDKAALRSGRVDKQIRFGLPGVEERSQAFGLYIRNVLSNSLYDCFDSLDVGVLAERSDGFNYADISQVVKNAVNKRAGDYISETEDSDDNIVDLPKVSMSYLLDAIEQVDDSKGRKRKIGFLK